MCPCVIIMAVTLYAVDTESLCSRVNNHDGVYHLYPGIVQYLGYFGAALTHRVILREDADGEFRGELLVSDELIESIHQALAQLSLAVQLSSTHGQLRACLDSMCTETAPIGYGLCSDSYAVTPIMTFWLYCAALHCAVHVFAAKDGP